MQCMSTSSTFGGLPSDASKAPGELPRRRRPCSLGSVLSKQGEALPMLTYKAAYQFVEGGVHAQVLDFPGAITCGSDLAETRRLLASALVDMAEVTLERGELLPRPDPLVSDPDADIEEPIYLHLRASTGVEKRPSGVVVP